MKALLGGIAALFLAAVSGGPALAQADTKAQFTCYAEGLANVTVSNVAGTGPSLAFSDYAIGPGVSVGLGCRWRMSDRWWLGGVFRYGFDNGGDSFSANGTTVVIERDRTWNALTQIGYDLTDVWSIYGTVGLVGSHYSARGLTLANVSDAHMGWAAGFGVDRKLTSSIALRMEYTYVDHNTQNFFVGTANAASLEPVEHVVRLGLTFHLWP